MAEKKLHDEDSLAAHTRRLWSVDGSSDDPGPLDLDRLIHERVRLGMMSALAVNGSLGFTDLKAILQTSDGNLITHARRLEDAGYVVASKEELDDGPSRTVYRLTPEGSSVFSDYLEHMEALIRATRDGGRG